MHSKNCRYNVQILGKTICILIIYIFEPFFGKYDTAHIQKTFGKDFKRLFHQSIIYK